MSRQLLLIDDSATMREILKVYLMGRGFSFIDCAGAARALEILAAQPVDLVIADINMPKMDGLTFVRTLRAHELPAVRNVPVILVTGDRGDDLRARGQEPARTGFCRSRSAATVDAARGRAPRQGLSRAAVRSAGSVCRGSTRARSRRFSGCRSEGSAR
ncbi:MAG: response regulator [Polyangiaceae bacterium]